MPLRRTACREALTVIAAGRDRFASLQRFSEELTAQRVVRSRSSSRSCAAKSSAALRLLAISRVQSRIASGIRPPHPCGPGGGTTSPRSEHHEMVGTLKGHKYCAGRCVSRWADSASGDPDALMTSRPRIPHRFFVAGYGHPSLLRRGKPTNESAILHRRPPGLSQRWPFRREESPILSTLPQADDHARLLSPHPPGLTIAWGRGY